MKTLSWSLFRLPLFLTLAVGSHALSAATDSMWTQGELTTLRTCQRIIQLFRQNPDSVWLGYDLSEMPFVAYVPDKWVLLLNYSAAIEDFEPYPASWPELGTPALLHRGPYKDLAGQLVFDFAVDTLQTVAIGVPASFKDSLSNPDAELLGYCVHEAFHRYQSTAFGDIPWEREEKYPILDRENTALAYLEMRLLMDALERMEMDDRRSCEDFTRQFVAVRDYRWTRGDPFVARYEQGQEIREGTAKYVETKSLELAKNLRLRAAAGNDTNSFQPWKDSHTAIDEIIADMKTRMTAGSIAPQDMPRNRMYPVGCAEGYLLDYFGEDWKERAQQAGSEFSFSRLLGDVLSVAPDDLPDLIERARQSYKHDQILAATDSLIAAYRTDFARELEAFEAQSGFRIEIAYTSQSQSRSRVSRARKWLMDNGTRALCRNYQVYTLKADGVNIQLHDSGVLEQTDWDKRMYRLVFFVPDLEAVHADGKPLDIGESASYSFEHLELSGTNFTLNATKNGKVSRHDKYIEISLIPE